MCLGLKFKVSKNVFDDFNKWQSIAVVVYILPSSYSLFLRFEFYKGLCLGI